MIHPDPDIMNFKDAVEAVVAKATAAQDRIVHLQSEINHLRGKTSETTQATATLEVALALNALVYVQSLKILMEHPEK